MSLRKVFTEGVLELILDRPEKKNALDPGMLETLRDTLKRHATSKELRALVISGADQNFCSGIDITHLAALAKQNIRDFHELREEVFQLLESFPVPTIASIQGHALGSGLLLALCADIRIASGSATFGIPSSSLGITESYSFTARLLRHARPGVASLMIYTGQKLSAETACALGLVEQVAPDEELQSRLRPLLDSLRNNATDAVRRSKKILQLCSNDPLLSVVSDPASPFVASVSSGEAREGTRAFLEKRGPEFKSPF